MRWYGQEAGRTLGGRERAAPLDVTEEVLWTPTYVMFAKSAS